MSLMKLRCPVVDVCGEKSAMASEALLIETDDKTMCTSGPLV